jgi:hypothetical protein
LLFAGEMADTPPPFAYVGETKELREFGVYVGEIKELGGFCFEAEVLGWG